MKPVTVTAIVSVLALTCIGLTLADPDFLFDNDYDSVMPGVRRSSSRRSARTPPPPLPHDSPIVFPGSGSVSDVEAERRRPVGIPVLPTNTRNTGSHTSEPGVLDLPTDINELDVGSLHRLNTITNISDFASLFDLELPEDDPETEGLSIAQRFGGTGDDAGETLPMANCKPELVTVPLDLPIDANTMYFPTCIRLEQCGGCCYGPLLICRPTVTKVVKVKVLKVNTARSSRRSGSSGGRRRRQSASAYHTVEAVKHTTCECGCKTREEDCNSNLHTYYEGECACVCKNKDEKAKCEQQNTTKYWDNNSCNCFCRKPLSCGSGEYFSQVSCSCERLSARSGILSPIDSEGSWGIPPPSRRRRKPVRVPIR